MAVTIEAEISTGVPRAELYALATNPARWPEWQKRFTVVEQVSEGPVAIGTSYRSVTPAVFGDIEVLSKITVFDGEEHFCMSGGSIVAGFESDWHFTGEGETSELKVTLVLRPKKTLAKVLVPWAKSVFRRRLQADLEGLKALADSR